MTQANKIFINQTSPATVYVDNTYNCPTMTMQVECDTGFQLMISSRTSSTLPYRPMDVISDNFNVVSVITNNNIYSLNIGGKTSIEFKLLSIDNGGTLNCYGNLF